MSTSETDEARSGDNATPAGPAHVPGETGSVAGPPAEVLATAAVTGAIDAGPAPSAPVVPGPPPFVGVASTLTAADEESATLAPADQAAGPAPGTIHEGIPLTVEEDE